MTKLTTERLETIATWREAYGNGANVMIPAEEAELMARQLLAYERAAKNEVALPEALKYAEIYGRAFICVDRSGSVHAVDPSQITLSILKEPAPAQPVIPEQTERERIRREHAEWSNATFGNVGPVGPLKHLSKEALEAAADPSDPLEWADMQFLLWDAQRRMGLSDEFITRAMIEKLEINKKRQWPEPKDGEPRLHINTQSAQPVSEPYRLPDGWVMVPEEATIAMLTLLGLTGSFDFMQQKYKNMLAAAPAQEIE
ncbi:DUF550 domain-containing protein [Hafnia paralvei]|uniref:DUF550 domain-containing protein n=1 Tax=Hafnia paralvei TaxID=546367 RepID=UPI001D0E82FD|nr:DUF550 domain-containing protein [Hafnia paralvei]MCE9946920.1 DUF550 domain-containing protein [Hafnia paralvei]